MPFPRPNRLKRPPIDAWPFQSKLYFPKGLFGFEGQKDYALIGLQNEQPFLRLVAIENRTLSFMVVDPFLKHPDYTPVLSKTDLKDIEVVHEAKLFMLAIVNTNEYPYTMNLSAPLLIHWSKRLGKQLLFPENYSYPIDDD